jgi:hypothetical protein
MNFCVTFPMPLAHSIIPYEPFTKVICGGK